MKIVKTITIIRIIKNVEKRTLQGALLKGCDRVR